MNQKHPIDDLFRSKLADYELPVKGDLKQVFLEKTQVKKKKKAIPMWLFAFAASMVAVLTFFWIGQESSESIKTPMAIKSTQAPKANKIVEESAVVEESIEAVREPLASTKVVKVAKSIVPEVKKAIPYKSATGLDMMDEVIPDELTIALLESERREGSKSTNATESPNQLFKNDIGETIIIIASDFEKEEELLIPEISADSPVTLLAATEIAKENSNENNSLLAKVFTNIKNLKHGEKMDLSLTAQNDLPEDTFIGNEAIEIKEKINWIKSKIAKR